MRYGYAPVSADDQNVDGQRVALARENCAEVIEETGSGTKARQRLDALLARLQPDDELMAIDLDRFGRGTAKLILMMDDLTKRGVVLRVLSIRSMDIRTDDGRLIADITAVLASTSCAGPNAGSGRALTPRKPRRSERPSASRKPVLRSAGAPSVESRTAAFPHNVPESRRTAFGP